ncbi:MAG: hypothetical protein GY934_15865 [Gammaproteobacteria bacterium]|nr:hypothetical protein [Gammaproteobacteria bacterium]
MQRALILCNGSSVSPDELCFEMEAQMSRSVQQEEPKTEKNRLNADLRSMEEQMILDALREGNGNRKGAAERLGISQRTLRYKIARLRDAGIAIPG